MVELVIDNLEELQKRFAQSPLIVGEELERATKSAGIGIIREETVQAPHDSGRLQQSIKMDYSPIEVSVTPDVDYAKYVVTGSQPHYAPIHALDAWSRRHGISPYALQQAIAKRGTKGNPFVKRTRDNIKDFVNDLFKKAEQNIISRL